MNALAEAAPPASQTRYSFITFLDPGDSSLPSQRRAVRSHAALYQHSQEKKGLSRSSKKKRPRKSQCAVFVPGSVIFTLTQHSSSDMNEPSSPRTLKNLTRFMSSPNPSMLGQGRVDPFRTYPVPWEPFIPELVDHCSYIIPIH
jgi:hypothetical protein